MFIPVSLPGSWNPAQAGQNATPADWNTLLADLAGGLSLALTTDGQSTVSADISLSGHKLTNVADATLRTDAPNAGNVQNSAFTYAIDTGAADACVITLAPAIASYVVGQEFTFKVLAANLTTTPTLAVNGFTAGLIKLPNGAALAAGDLPANAMVAVIVASVTTGTPVFHLQTVASPVRTNGVVAMTAAINEAKGANIASATTTDIGAATGNYVHVTGVTTITGLGTVQAGTERTVVFDGILLLTHNATSLILPGAGSITTAAGDSAIFRSEGSGNWKCVEYTRAAQPPSVILRGFVAGLTLSAAGATATFGVAAGQATDSTNAAYMALASAYTKTTAAWAVGSGNGSLDTGSIATGTWYSAYLIQRSDTGVVDVLTSLSATAPTMPTGYDRQRRIGFLKTNGSSQWIKFIQDGDYFAWDVAVLDVNDVNPGTSAVTKTLASVPTGANVFACLNIRPTFTSNVASLFVSDLATSDQAPSNTVAPLATNSSTQSMSGNTTGTYQQIRTNTSAQIRYRLDLSGAGDTVAMATLGWIDRRGQGS